mgnify:FL=1
MKRTTDEIKQKFADYWPKAEIPDAVKSLWRERLRNLNNNVLWEAFDEVRVKYSSQTPQIKWVLDSYHEIYRSRYMNSPSSIQNDSQRILEEQADRESRDFADRAKADLDRISEDELRAVADQIPIVMDPNPKKWGSVQRGLVWVKLFGSSQSSASPSLSPDPVPHG